MTLLRAAVLVTIGFVYNVMEMRFENIHHPTAVAMEFAFCILN